MLKNRTVRIVCKDCLNCPVLLSGSGEGYKIRMTTANKLNDEFNELALLKLYNDKIIELELTN